MYWYVNKYYLTIILKGILSYNGWVFNVVDPAGYISELCIDMMCWLFWGA